MNISNKGVAFITQEEGIRLKAYLDAVGVATIGCGSTEYENGVSVKITDKPITRERANLLFHNTLKKYVSAVNIAVKQTWTQNQFDSLVSLCYNIGTHGFSSSTLVKLININPLDHAITEAFDKWCKAGGKPILLSRRQREAKLYFS